MSNFINLGENVTAIIPQKDFCAGHRLVRVTAIHAACYWVRLNSWVVSCASVAVVVV